MVSSDDRLEIWSLQSSIATILHILLPYDHLQLHARQVAFASLIDSNHLLTYNSEGLAVLWDLASGNSLYQCQFNPHSKPTLSPSGTYLVMEQGKVAVLLETLTGKVFGELDLDGLTSATYSISDSGNQLLAYTGGHMRLYDLTNGQFISESSMNESSGSLFLPRDGLALLNDTHFIDLNKHVSLNIAQDASSRSVVGKAGMLFSILTDTTHKTLALRGIAVPTDSMLADLAALNPDELLVLKPGIKVRLSINISGDEPQRQKAIDALKKNIADAGLILEDAGTAHLYCLDGTRQIPRNPVQFLPLPCIWSQADRDCYRTKSYPQT
ncbi:MAG: hypothetical protein HC898_10590 [Phycisphaerales bacterium]|nr:hypothetical protein [Phycisphaerales bacterium]